MASENAVDQSTVDESTVDKGIVDKGTAAKNVPPAETTAAAFLFTPQQASVLETAFAADSGQWASTGNPDLFGRPPEPAGRQTLFTPSAGIENAVPDETVPKKPALETTLEAAQFGFEAVLNKVPIEVVIFDADHRYVFCNPEAVKDETVRAWLVGQDDFEYCRRLGLELSLATTRRARFRAAIENRAVESWEETVRDDSGDVRHHWRNLMPVFGADGNLDFVIGYGRDITERKHAKEALERFNSKLESRVKLRTAELEAAKLHLENLNLQLQHDAFHDALTGLPNRALFKDRLAQAVEREKRRPENGFAVLFLDFDRFKVINDSLGHEVGDKLLVALGERLRDCVRPGDTVARLGGDEFTLLLEDLAQGGSEAVKTAERVQQALKRPFQLAGQTLALTVSIGVVPSMLGYEHAEEVLRDANLAMYEAKKRGRAGYRLFSPQLREQALRRLGLETDLRSALAARRLGVQYQPIVAVQTGLPVGFEALVRWSHPVHGPVSPDTFVPLAEEVGLVTELDLFVLRTACLQVRAWQQQFPQPPALTLSANLSGKSVAYPGLLARVEAVLDETGFDPRNLKLELTESVLVGSSGEVLATLNQLRALGITLHIDDFGTGYSSLAYLQNLPVSTLKVDRSFVAHMFDNLESAELVRTVVAMAKALGLSVTAEGVETAEQFMYLKALGCENAQGYFFSRPLPAEGVASYMLTPAPKLAVELSVSASAATRRDELGTAPTTPSGVEHPPQSTADRVKLAV